MWDDSARRLGIDTAPLSRVRPQDAKWNLPLGGHDRAAPARIGLLVCLKPSERGDEALEEITGADRFTVLRNNVFRPEYYAAMGIETRLLGRIAELASTTQMVRLMRPAHGFEIDRQIDKLLALHSAIAEPERRIDQRQAEGSLTKDE